MIRIEHDFLARFRAHRVKNDKHKVRDVSEFNWPHQIRWHKTDDNLNWVQQTVCCHQFVPIFDSILCSLPWLRVERWKLDSPIEFWRVPNLLFESRRNERASECANYTRGNWLSPKHICESKKLAHKRQMRSLTRCVIESETIQSEQPELNFNFVNLLLKHTDWFVIPKQQCELPNLIFRKKWKMKMKMRMESSEAERHTLSYSKPSTPFHSLAVNWKRTADSMNLKLKW